ncbi:hypothetical protein M2323_001405 [Rhodoblastus acidophilus]|uniref:hypothetical protein n=1 Tax=Rhodoblastus acidophilus TaxID=1074 RepID=UPI0022256437|nr:hypothetical protein [Rhodoblastus acidophilus]MCW2283633.1 hypothetical protein [Rhodoblastus acidophilus]MCW2332493.1 hypothetical protein [Rhodoblastus acidophilus]
MRDESEQGRAANEQPGEAPPPSPEKRGRFRLGLQDAEVHTANKTAIAAVVVAAVSCIVGIAQWIEIKEQAMSARLQATADRAYLFIDVKEGWPHTTPPIDWGEGAEKANFEIEFSITNFGKSPSVIKGISGHLFFCDSEPDPGAKKDRSAHETGVRPAALLKTVDGNLVPVGQINDRESDQAGNMTAVIRAGETLHFSKEFLFAPFSGNVKAEFLGRKFWLYTTVRYENIYGEHMETSRFTEYPGGARGPEKYNYWDRPYKGGD